MYLPHCPWPHRACRAEDLFTPPKRCSQWIHVDDAPSWVATDEAGEVYSSVHSWVECSGRRQLSVYTCVCMSWTPHILPEVGIQPWGQFNKSPGIPQAFLPSTLYAILSSPFSFSFSCCRPGPAARHRTAQNIYLDIRSLSRIVVDFPAVQIPPIFLH